MTNRLTTDLDALFGEPSADETPEDAERRARLAAELADAVRTGAAAQPPAGIDDPETVAAFISGGLPAEARQAVLDHLASPEGAPASIDIEAAAALAQEAAAATGGIPSDVLARAQEKFDAPADNVVPLAAAQKRRATLQRWLSSPGGVSAIAAALVLGIALSVMMMPGSGSRLAASPGEGKGDSTAALLPTAPDRPAQGLPPALPPENPPADSASPLQWAVIAYSRSTGASGTASGQLSQADAEKAALDMCKARGANDCRVEIARQGQCVALGREGGDRIATGAGATRKEASAATSKACSDNSLMACLVVASACSGGS